MSLDIDSNDVIRLVLQFLKENNLLSSMQQLQRESGVTLNTVDNVDSFLHDIRHGRWDSVLAQVGTLKLPLEKLTALYEQVVLELLECGERDLAKELVRSSEPLLVLKAIHPERHLRLETFCKRPYFNASDAYEMGTTKESRRQDIAISLAIEVSSVESSRLLALIGQALKYQQAEGLLPQGNNFDLFRNARKAARRDVDEKIVKHESLPLQKVKIQSSTTLVFSPQGNNFVLGGSDGCLEVWDTESSRVRDDLDYQHEDRFMQQEASITTGVFSKDGDHIALGDTAGTIKIWRISTAQCLRTFANVHRLSVLSLCFAKDGTQLLSASSDCTAKIHGLKGGRTLKEFRGHTAYVTNALYSKDSTNNIITASADGTVRLWDAKTTECLVISRPGLSTGATSIAEVGVHTMRYIPGSDQIMICTNSPKAFIINSTCQTLQTFSSGKKTGGDFVAATISSQGKWLYCAGEDKVLYVFDIKTSKLEEVVPLNVVGDILQLVHHPQRNILAIITTKGTVSMLSAE